MLKFNNYTYTLQFYSYTKMVTVKNLFLRSFSRKSKKLAEISRFFGKKRKTRRSGRPEFRQTGNCCKRVLEAAKHANANKTKESVTFATLGELQR